VSPDPPAGGGGGRLAEVRRLGLTTPSSHRQTKRARVLGDQLQPPRRRHGQAGDFANHSAEAAVTQAVLEGGQQSGLVAGLHIDDPV